MKQFFFGLFLTAMLVALSVSGRPALAQVVQWIQIEAQPSLRKAQTRTRRYAGQFENVNGFAIGRGWYAIALGPYTPAAATQRLRQLKRQGLIPNDSFVADGSNFRQRFWPVGATGRVPQPETLPTTVQPVTPQTTPVILAPAPDETPRQARRSEAQLDRDARKELQSALEWEGFYSAAIDGAFGRGTRAAMRDWQEANGYEGTGVLTTRQRQELLASYRSVLNEIGMQPVRDETAGIEIEMPLGLVGFSRYEAPFAHYDSKNGSKVRVLLISQYGDQTTLFGLYDILQTLEIIPPDGERIRRKRSFELVGKNDRIVSYTHAALKDGMVKGFILVWPAGDEKRRQRVLKEMQASFRPFGDVALDDLVGGAGEDQRIDLLSGLEIRKPALSRSGFYVDDKGAVLTTMQAIEGCSRITLNNDYEAEIIATDNGLGLALLKPETPLAPMAFARFRDSIPRLKSEIAVAGYSYEGILDAPTLTFGTLVDIRGLRGESTLQRLKLTTQSGDAGGPVLDAGGFVQAMLIPKPKNGAQRLPDDVQFGASASALRKFLQDNGVNAATGTPDATLPPEDLTLIAEDMTVLVSCWQ